MLHIIPYSDSDIHSTEGNLCRCNPTVEIIGVQTIIVHNSFDGREFQEEINSIINNEPYIKANDSFKERVN